MPNRPFGNDFFVNTPKLDQLEQRMYAEQKQREAKIGRDINALDEEFSKNVTNIRDADVDELTKAYQDYKLLSQAVMKQKKGVSPQEQMEVLRKKADMYKLINESKAEREREEMMGKRYATKPDDFNDNAAELLITGRNLPIYKKKNYATKEGGVIDLTNPENLLWQDKINWQPILQKAGGTLTPRGQIVKTKLPGGLETEEVTYKGGSDPLEYYTSIIGAMNTPRASQSLSNRYKFTPEEAQDITMKFEALQKDPAFKNAYGEIKFPESSNLTEGTRTAKLLAMQNAINNPPTPSKKNIPNKLAITNRNEAFQLKKQAISEAGKNSRFYAGLNRQRPGLGDYDILSLYDPKVQEIEIETPAGKDFLGRPKTEKKKVTVLYKKDIDGNDEKYFEGATPYRDKNDQPYYIQRSDGDYEGNGGKVIQRTTAAIKFMGNPAAYKGGVLTKEPVTRLPKDIKNTRMTPKPKPY